MIEADADDVLDLALDVGRDRFQVKDVERYGSAQLECWWMHCVNWVRQLNI